MQSEEFDKKVREAADHHHPAYDERAWEKMEKLLDTHLPQKKDGRKRYVLLMLLFLIVGGGLYIMIAKPWQPGRPVADKNLQQDISAKATKNAETDKPEKLSSGNVPFDNKDADQNKIINENIKLQETPGLNHNNYISSVIINKTEGRKNKTGKKTDNVAIDNTTVEVKDNITAKTDLVKNDPALKNNDHISDQPVNNKLVTEPAKIIEENKNTEQISAANSTQAAEKIRVRNKKSNSFFFSVSAGPDVSFAGLENLGKLKLLGGAGIGYSFRNKFTLRTGFYVTNKIYSADPYQYHLASPGNPNYRLISVDADCKVYEIPVLLSYNFSRIASSSWFATTGISSYLMKKETYDYLYKNAAGQIYSHKWTLKDKNKHYFSVLTLGGGYQRNINNTFSIMAEPYIKIPLSGIGYGKVKLNSAGVMVSAKIKLFGSGNKAHN